MSEDKFSDFKEIVLNLIDYVEHSPGCNKYRRSEPKCDCGLERVVIAASILCGWRVT